MEYQEGVGGDIPSDASADVPIEFMHMYNDIENIMNLFKDERFTIREDAISAIKSGIIYVGDFKGRLGSNLLTYNHILESQHINPRIRAKCITAIDNLRKIRTLLPVYDDMLYLKNNN